MSAHAVGSGRAAHLWVDAVGEVAGSVRLLDSRHFTVAGRRLLAALGVLEPDPLRVAADEWLASRRGPQTEATLAVRRALGPPVPAEWLVAAERMRRTPWKGPIR